MVLFCRRSSALASLVLLPCCHGENATLAAQLRERIQPILEEFALKYNTSFSYGFRDDEAIVGLAAGLDDHITQTKVTNTSLFPMGSVTKTWTATAVLRLVEQGVWSLDAIVADILDPFLQEARNTSMEQLWGDSRIRLVTIRHLLQMRSGIADYDDGALTKWTFDHPDEDYTPFMMIEKAEKKMNCDPGECGFYSSVGYNLLGLMLATRMISDSRVHPDSTTWMKVDQLRAALPNNLYPEFKHTIFPLHGKCASYASKGMVHQYYANITRHLEIIIDVSFSDIMQYSCLNGWTCGNIAASTTDVASFYYHLNKGHIVSKASLDEMLMKPKPITMGWGMHLQYGLGIFEQNFKTQDGQNWTNWGHGGMDWGSASQVSGFDKELGFGISVASNTVFGMNCSLHNPKENFQAGVRAACQMYDATLKVLKANGRRVPVGDLNCEPKMPAAYKLMILRCNPHHIIKLQVDDSQKQGSEGNRDVFV